MIVYAYFYFTFYFNFQPLAPFAYLLLGGGGGGDVTKLIFDLLYHLLSQAKIFHYGSISLITEPCKSAHIAAAKAAKDAGAVLSYDPNLRLPLWPSADSAIEGILSIWDTADIIKVDFIRLEIKGVF